MNKSSGCLGGGVWSLPSPQLRLQKADGICMCEVGEQEHRSIVGTGGGMVFSYRWFIHCREPGTVLGARHLMSEECTPCHRAHTA